MRLIKQARSNLREYAMAKKYNVVTLERIHSIEQDIQEASSRGATELEHHIYYFEGVEKATIMPLDIIKHFKKEGFLTKSLLVTSQGLGTDLIKITIKWEGNL